MGAGCISCNQEKSSDELSILGVYVPETLKINVFPVTSSVVISEYESVQLLSLPSLSNENSAKSGSFNARISREVNRIMNAHIN